MKRSKEKGGGYRRQRRKGVAVADKRGKEEGEESSSAGVDGGGSRFFGCYLLTSLSPRHKGHTYIGFTVNPKRRIRQHNGEITSGASTTKKKRPWEMVLCIHGFPTNVAALQFEWAWQNPRESIAVRDSAATFKTLAGLANKIKLALTMLTLPSWNCMDLTVSFFSTMYMKHAAGCPALPPQIKLHFCSMDELPCYCHPHPYPFAQRHHFDDPIQQAPTSTILDFDSSSLPPQTHTLRDATQCSSHQPATDCLLEEDSSSILPIAIPDDQNQPLHHFPSPRDELFNIHTRPFSIGLFFNNDAPILKRPMQASHQLTAHLHSFTHYSFNDHTTLSKGIWPEDSFASTKEHIVPFQHADPSVRDQSPMPACISISRDGSKKEKFNSILVDESPNQFTQLSHETCRGSSSAQGFEPVEVVDLLTPSPDCRIVAVAKKRRLSGHSPNIIDLTRSPLFLEL